MANDADGNYVPSDLERTLLYGKPWKGGEFDGGRVGRIRRYADPVVDALMDRSRSVLEDLFVYTTGKPFAGYPSGQKPWEVEKAVNGSPEGAIDFLPSLQAGLPELADPEASPRDRAMARSRVNLFNLKRRLFPVLDNYIEEMEKRPSLDNRDTMAGMVMTTLMYVTKVGDVLKCLKQLQEIFGHSQQTVVVEDKTSFEQRKARLMATVHGALRENGLLGEVIDAEGIEANGAGHRGLAGGSFPAGVGDDGGSGRDGTP